MGSPAAGLKLSLEGENFPNYVVSGLFHGLKHEDFIAFLKKFSLLGFVLTLVNSSTVSLPIVCQILLTGSALDVPSWFSYAVNTILLSRGEMVAQCSFSSGGYG